MNTNDHTLCLYTELLNSIGAMSKTHVACCSHMVGNQYYDSKSKIMLVGRAINGWENYWQHDMSVEQYAKRVLSNSIESNGLSWTRSSNNPSGYNINRSAFWRVTRGIIQGLGEDISSDWTEKLCMEQLVQNCTKRWR